ncbi:MAG: tetratricopeptide repeat protein, partial [Candidatus Saccharimonas sp.]|nr:tetratricopeptide repeat protein [Planctomycetaceae bacterium]
MATEQSLIDELAAARNRPLANDPQLAAALQRLARWYSERRQPGRARVLVQELWTLQSQTQGELHESTIDSLSWLASLFASLGKLDRADQLLSDLAARCDNIASGSVNAVAAALNQFAELHYHRGQFDSALATCRRVLTLLGEGDAARASSPDPSAAPTRTSHPQLVRARNNLAALHVARGEYDQARRAFIRNLREARRRLAPGDPALIVQWMNLASVLRLSGQIQQSERLTARAVRKCQRAIGWYHPLVAQGLANLGAYRLQGGRAESAKALLRKALKIRRRLHPAGHTLVARTQRQLAEALLALGKHGAAERLLDRTVIAFEKQQPVDEIQLALTLCSLGFVYLTAGRHANAERMLNRAHEIQQRRLAPHDPQLVQTLNGLGCLNAARLNPDVARTFHQRALEMTEQS